MAQCPDTVLVLVVFDIVNVLEEEGEEDGEKTSNSD